MRTSLECTTRRPGRRPGTPAAVRRPEAPTVASGCAASRRPWSIVELGGAAVAGAAVPPMLATVAQFFVVVFDTVFKGAIEFLFVPAPDLVVGVDEIGVNILQGDRIVGDLFGPDDGRLVDCRGEE